ncbi:efflux RND transporter periplasmic adaptor subunit [Dokdonella soli]|uniref:Efflux RND transporter periplasmic adaptor subunit n=1 Tax=Dokdonella soli TaxID=529810 RepID=A0ABN1IG13_9GAMM
MSRWKLALAVVAVVILAILGWRLLQQAPQAGGGKPGGAGTDTPIPVTVVPAATQDVPVYLTALGTVQALNTVTVNAQVSGQLKAIHFAEGQEIRQGDLIAEIDPRTFQAALEQAEAKKKQDAAQLVASRSTLARFEELMKRNFVSGQDLENQRQTVRQQEALVAADEAAASNARTQLGYTRIVAPITGVAGIRQIDVGNLVQANGGTGIVVLTQVHPINVIFTLPQQNLGDVRTANSDPLPVTALNRADSHAIAQGVLKVIDNTIDTQTGTFKLKSEFSNEKSELWPGQFVNVKLQTKTVHGGLVIPVQAVQRGPDSSYVYLLQGDSTVAMQTIETGGDAGDGGMLVASGLKAGDKVVTEGQFRLKPGAKVLPLAPGENAPALTAEELKKAATPGKGGARRGG